MYLSQSLLLWSFLLPWSSLQTCVWRKLPRSIPCIISLRHILIILVHTISYLRIFFHHILTLFLLFVQVNNFVVSCVEISILGFSSYAIEIIGVVKCGCHLWVALFWIDAMSDVGVLLTKFLLFSISRITLAFWDLINIFFYDFFLGYVIFLNVWNFLLRWHWCWLIQRIELRCGSVIVIFL
jgi:hypothetical protein